MYDDVIKFSYRESDLDKTPDYWAGAAYDVRKKDLTDIIEKTTGFVPSKNIRLFREGVFKVNPDTTIEDLVSLSAKIKKLFVIDCFQCSIDRESGTAHLLFDWYNRDLGKCVYINRSEQVVLSVLILRTLDLPRPAGTDLWLRHFLFGEYSDNPDVFCSILDQLKHVGLGKHSYGIVRDALAYAHKMCQGLVK